MKKFCWTLIILMLLSGAVYLAQPFLAGFFERPEGESGESLEIPAAGRMSFSFENIDPVKTWRLHEFKNRTEYTLENELGGKSLHAVSQGSSSALFRENLQVQVAERPFLVWQWKVTQFPSGKKNQALAERSENDFAGRVYAIFKGRRSLSHEVIQYVWDDHFPEDTTADGFSLGNVKVKVLVVQSGPAPAEGWVSERRDLAADYEKVFGKPAEGRLLKGFGLMTDSDNTASGAEAWFREFAVEISAPVSLTEEAGKSRPDPLERMAQASEKIADGLKAGGRKTAAGLRRGTEFIFGGFRKDNR